MNDTPAPEHGTTTASGCPVCGGDNRCSADAGAATCWCFDQQIDSELVAWLERQGVEPRCLCRACAAGRVPSPCIGVCMIDNESGSCLGCHRTIDEITDWNRRSASAKADILQRLRQQQPVTSPG